MHHGEDSAPRSEQHGTDQRSARDYRPDIDGLRALAVLPIVAFHLDMQSFAGGYVGVDIFFVISGYLIGGSVLSQVFAGAYSVQDFYARRFRRIFPALAFALFITTVAVLVLALPDAAVDYGRSLIASTLSVSNFYFLETSNYFDPAAETKPLLHTWSLAVEEQFYLLFPLLVIVVARFGRRFTLGVLASLTAASFIGSVIGVHAAPLSTFYLLPTRIWELLLGVLASQLRFPLPGGRIGREGAACLGLALMLLPVVLYTSATPFPGLAALPPCAGVALLLIVGAQGGSAAGKALALAPLTFFGLISYSLYLWHWPVIVLIKEWLPAPTLDRPLQVAALAMSVGLAWFSWKFVERPWRSPAVRPRAIFRSAATSAVGIIVLGTAIIATQGFPSRFSPKTLRLASYQNRPATRSAAELECVVDRDEAFDRAAAAKCLATAPGRPSLIVMGDSHAEHLRAGLSARYPELRLREAIATNGCKPLVHFSEQKDRPGCIDLRRFMFEDYLPSRLGDWVLLSAEWSPTHARALGETIDWLKARGLNVIVAGPIVHYSAGLPQILALANARGDPTLPNGLRSRFGEEDDVRYRDVTKAHGGVYFSTYRALCPTGACLVLTPDGAPVQADRAHLTVEGSRLVAARFPIGLVRQAQMQPTQLGSAVVDR